MTKKKIILLLLGLLAALTTFHLLILVKVVPYEITWGGRLKSDSDMYIFEGISLIVTLFLTIMVLMKAGYLKRIVPDKVINFVLWCFLILFGFNTATNLIAKTVFEKYFAILTLILTYLIYKILRGNDE